MKTQTRPEPFQCSLAGGCGRCWELRRAIDRIKEKIESGHVRDICFVGDVPVFKKRPHETKES